MSFNYKDAGVDIQAGDALVEWLQKTSPKKSAHQERIVDGIGGFASLFRCDFPEMKEPCLVSATDGVGTKLKIAIEFESYESVAQDLVAMCVNDLITTGGKPLFFLDYYATGKLNIKAAQEFLTGVRKACEKSRCALVGGETAEMPGMYHNNDFDCAGFAVGIVDRQKMLGRHKVSVGDTVIGVSSNGFHSNGYSWLRKVFEKDLSDWANILLRPTHLYVELVQSLDQSQLKSIAHITGGGIHNIPRVLPKDVKLKLNKWEWPAEFKEVQKRTKSTEKEMLETLNCGIGMVFVMAPAYEKEFKKVAKGLSFQTYDLGTVDAGNSNQEEAELTW